MKTINRRMIRGYKLGLECMNAYIDHDIIEGFKFCFCYGKRDSSTDEPLNKCKRCKAWNNNFTFEKAYKIIEDMNVDKKNRV